MLPHLLSRVINVPLAIEPGKLEVILEVLNQKLRGSVESTVSLVRNAGDYKKPEIRSISIFGEEEQSLVHAVIPIHGTLVQRTRGLGAMSGLTSYERIRTELEKAINDPSVTGITLEIDSPGGEVAGLFDLVDFIYEARDKKPITAFVNETGFSAAYAIASAASKIVMPRTGGVGSIGVIAVHVDQSKFDEKAGLKYTPVYAGARKNDFSRHEPLSDEALARLQAIVNDHYELFVDTVSRNRGLSAKDIKATEAGLYFGSEALDVGLADEIKPFQTYLEEQTMGEKQDTKLESQESKIKASEGEEPEKATGENATADEKVIEITEAAKRAAAREERERIRTIEALCSSVSGMLSEKTLEELKAKLIDEGVEIPKARELILDAVVEETSRDEINSSTGALSTGGVNPVVAEAERRAQNARKEA